MTIAIVLNSVGRRLRVKGPDRLADWWPRVHPALPGCDAEYAIDAAADAPEVRLAEDVTPGDARRIINVHLHRLHLAHGTLCLHGVALRHPSKPVGVLLLGGHGTGKSLAGMALALRGWRVVAGDVALVDASRHGPALLGGTTAFLMRREPARRWFPELDLPAVGSHMADLGPLLERAAAPLSLVASVAVAVAVDVDGDPTAGPGTCVALDSRSSAATLLRASGSLLDRLPDNQGMILRSLESGAEIVRRTALVRDLAVAVPVHRAWGAPRMIADHVERVAVAGQVPTEGSSA